MFADFLPQPFRPPSRAQNQRRAPLRAQGSADRPEPGVFVTAVRLAVAAPRVFHLLADIEALPRWAAPFCEGLRLAQGRWRALTALGDLWCALEADGRTGVIDLRLEPGTGRTGLLVPLRVAALPSGGSLVALALARAPDQPAREFEHERTTLDVALQALEGRFGCVTPHNVPPGGSWAPSAAVTAEVRPLAWLSGLEKAPPLRFQFLY